MARPFTNFILKKFFDFVIRDCFVCLPRLSLDIFFFFIQNEQSKSYLLILCALKVLCRQATVFFFFKSYKRIIFYSLLAYFLAVIIIHLFMLLSFPKGKFYLDKYIHSFYHKNLTRNIWLTQNDFIIERCQ